VGALGGGIYFGWIESMAVDWVVGGVEGWFVGVMIGGLFDGDIVVAYLFRCMRN